MASTRYLFSTTIGAGADALNVRWGLDVVDYSGGVYHNDARTVNTTTLVGVGYALDKSGETISKNGIPNEFEVATLPVKLYDTASRAAWAVIQGGLADDKRLHIIREHYDGAWIRDFTGVVDRTSIIPEVRTITFGGATFDSVIPLNAVSLAKTVLQDVLMAVATPAKSKGAWDYKGTYAINDIVTYGGVFYIAIARYAWRGAWRAYTAYIVGDAVVVYAVSWWAPICYHCISNVGPSAPNPASDATHWSAYPSPYTPSAPPSDGVVWSVYSSQAAIVPTYHGVGGFFVPYFWYSWKAGFSPPTTFPNFTDLQFASLADLVAAIANYILLATEYSAITVNVTLDHLGVIARKAGTGPPTTYQYGLGATPPHDAQLADAIALNKHTFIDNSGGADSDREYNLTKQNTVYDSLKLICDSVLCAFRIGWDAANSQLALSIFSALSPTITSLVTGDTEQIPRADTLRITAQAYNLPAASCGVMRPKQLSTETQNDTSSDTLTPTYSAPFARNGSGMAGRTMFSTTWNDNGGGNGNGLVPFAENALAVFDDTTTHANVIACDFDMTDAATHPDYAYANAYTVAQGWGGGALAGGSNIVHAAHWQQALAKGLYSLFCGGPADGTSFAGAELVECEIPWTGAMITAIAEATTFLKVRLRTDTVARQATAPLFLLLGAEYNTYDDSRMMKITAIRNLWP